MEETKKMFSSDFSVRDVDEQDSKINELKRNRLKTEAGLRKVKSMSAIIWKNIQDIDVTSYDMYINSINAYTFKVLISIKEKDYCDSKQYKKLYQLSRIASDIFSDIGIILKYSFVSVTGPNQLCETELATDNYNTKYGISNQN